jgi:hypothetical protein
VLQHQPPHQGITREPCQRRCWRIQRQQSVESTIGLGQQPHRQSLGLSRYHRRQQLVAAPTQGGNPRPAPGWARRQGSLGSPLDQAGGEISTVSCTLASAAVKADGAAMKPTRHPAMP